jgi:hypothetical protein
MPRKGFKEYSSEESLNESTWLSKGFALGQGSRHAGTKRQLESLTSEIRSICDHGKHEEDTGQRLIVLFDAIAKLALCLRLQAELSHNVLNVGIASNLLEDDLSQAIKRMQPKK